MLFSIFLPNVVKRPGTILNYMHMIRAVLNITILLAKAPHFLSFLSIPPLIRRSSSTSLLATVAELKEHCKLAGLPVSGSKAILLQRLAEEPMSATASNPSSSSSSSTNPNYGEAAAFKKYQASLFSTHLKSMSPKPSDQQLTSLLSLLSSSNTVPYIVRYQVPAIGNTLSTNAEVVYELSIRHNL